MVKFWKEKENHILKILKNKGYTVKLIENLDENGNEMAQVYYVGEYARSRPDIDVYSSKEKTEVILRVEVKGYADLPSLNGKSVLPIKESQFEHYKEFEFLSEVETKIIFVVGRNGNYDYYWETLRNMDKMKKYKSKWQGRMDNKEYDYYFFNPKNMKSGLKDFC